MIVKDLQKYVNAKADGKIVETVGTANDPFLSFFAGKSSVDLEQHVGTITKFATNTGTQIFYEFLQNADDAKGSRVLFFFKDNHFVVINNGSPFFTDTNDSKRKGQLFSFLWKEKMINLEMLIPLANMDKAQNCYMTFFFLRLRIHLQERKV